MSEPKTVKVKNVHTARVNGIEPGAVGEVDERIANATPLLQVVEPEKPKAEKAEKPKAEKPS